MRQAPQKGKTTFKEPDFEVWTPMPNIEKGLNLT